MSVSGSIRHEHVSGLPLACVVLTMAFALMLVSTISAQVFSPEFFVGKPRALQFSTIPHRNIWPDLTSAIFFSPKQEIDSIRTILTDAPHPELHGSLARSASFKTFYLHTFDQSRNYGRFALDFLFPSRTVNTNTYFAEFHGEFEQPDYLHPSSHRTDLSLGLGQRLIGNGDFLLGVNAFVDTSSVYDGWYWSGGVGFETALNISKTSNYPFEALDLSLNLYKGGGLDLESGVSLLLGDYGKHRRLRCMLRNSRNKRSLNSRRTYFDFQDLLANARFSGKRNNPLREKNISDPYSGWSVYVL